MTKFIIAYDHDEATDTEISIRSESGEIRRFPTISAAAEAVNMEGPELIDKLEAGSGEYELNAQ